MGRQRYMKKILQLHFFFKQEPLIKWLTRLSCSLLVVLIYSTAYGQSSFNVSGTVKDATTGEALPGVNIVVKGTTIGTATDAKGHYTLGIPSQADTLVYSYIGYTRKLVAVQGRSTINVKLTSKTISGQQLVVVGYSTQKKKDLTGSVSVVNTKDMANQPDAQVTKQLQGQASGVTVQSNGQPGQQPTVHIRGFNTFGNNTPLYVVDGVPTQDISNLTPDNVQSIQVLKDAGAASIYGARASNGVIIITTKQGRKGKVTVNYNASYGVQQPKQGNVWNMLSPLDQAKLRWKAITNSGGNPRPDAQYGNGQTPRLPNYITPTGAMKVDKSKYFVDPNYTSTSEFNSFYRIDPANKSGTDWYHQIFKNAPIDHQNLSVSGGSKIGNYFFSADYMNQQGTLIDTYLKKYAIRANSNFNVGNHIKIGENMAYSISQNPRSATNNEGSAIGMALREQPIVPVHDIMGNFAGSYGKELGNARNPVAIQYRTRNNRGLAKRLFGNAFAQVDFLKNFNFRTSFGGSISSSFYHSFAFPEYENAENNTTNSFSESSYHDESWTWDNTLTFQKDFLNKHNVKILLGTEAHKDTGTGLGGTTQDYFSFNPAYTNLSTGSGTQTNFSYTYGTSLFSLFGRVNYSYMDKYLFSFTLRRDGSSKFLDNRYGLFPAVSAGWRISNENFMQNIKWISDLKIRGSYGVMGNQLNVDPANGYSLYAGDNTYSYYPISGNNSQKTLGFIQSRIGNPAARWEKDVNANIGFDATLFNGWLEITMDYYNKDIKDLLYNPPLPGTAGLASAPYKNVGSMQDHGVDLTLKGNQGLSSGLNLNETLSFTTYHNKIVSIAPGINYFQQDSRRFNGVDIIRNAVGHAVSSFYGYKIVGFWNSKQEIQQADAKAQKATGSSSATYQTGEGVGRFRYQDTNGDGQITSADRTYLGNPNPKFTYGLNLGANYKNFDFSIFLYGVYGNQIWNQVKWFTDFYSSFEGAKSHTALYNSWTPQNHNAKVSIQENGGSFSTNEVPNSYYVENGSYLRAKNVVIGYTLPDRLVGQLGASKLRVYVKAANLFTITPYSGITPAIAGSGSSSTDFGIDLGSYASPREFLIGANLSF